MAKDNDGQLKVGAGFKRLACPFSRLNQCCLTHLGNPFCLPQQILCDGQRCQI